MHQTTTAQQEATSVLATLRRLAPNRRLELSEALWIAERQANRLLELRGALDVPVPTTVVTELPRIIVEHDPDLPADAASGCSDWDFRRRTWVISLNPTEPRRRRRFTVLHEYKHIIDHGSHGIRSITKSMPFQRPAEELVADYFAGCVLMPKRLLTAAYYDGIQAPADLAELFDVSERAVLVRLSQIGLGEPPQPRSRWHRPTYRYQQGRQSQSLHQPYYRTATGCPEDHMEVAR